MRLYNDDCLNVLKNLPDNSIDLVLNDPPYGTTSIKWDKILDFGLIWEELQRVMKPKTNAIFFGSQPFSSLLITSKLDWFKYELIWNKNKCGSPGLAKKRPLKVHENILVFANGTNATYNPIMESGKSYERKCKSPDGYGTGTNTHKYGFGKNKITHMKNDGTRYPKSILHASRNFSAQQTIHPTQKPTNILNWLIMTYSNPGDVVLDFTMGCGSTGVSAKLTGRDFIGIELEKKYFDLAKERIELVDYTIVDKNNSQLTTQIHTEMKTVPEEKYEKAFNKRFEKDK
jgi:site-specific DNA-methyltransferase (adenine-specific)